MNKNEIHVIYDKNPMDMVKEVLYRMRVEEELSPDMVIGIKPNLVVAKPADEHISRKYSMSLYDLKEDSYEIKKAGDMELKVCSKAPLRKSIIPMITIVEDTIEKAPDRV